jgi:LAO/AO transport system kinase
MLLVEAAGYDVVIIETVGVGQSETAVAEMVDMFLLLQSPGGGDELQGIKRGIMEMADLIVVNKADGALEKPAKMAQAEYIGALGLMRPKSPNWTPEVLLASALKNIGITEIWDAICTFEQRMVDSGELQGNRARQATSWMWSEIGEGLMDRFKADKAVADRLPGLEKQVADGQITPSAAAAELLGIFKAT